VSAILQEGFEAQAASLRDFGYPDVTAEMIREAHRKWMAGEDLVGIIEMMCERAFEDHPRIFGEKP
jgi:hypothetical protein